MRSRPRNARPAGALTLLLLGCVVGLVGLAGVALAQASAAQASTAQAQSTTASTESPTTAPLNPEPPTTDPTTSGALLDPFASTPESSTPDSSTPDSSITGSSTTEAARQCPTLQEATEQADAIFLGVVQAIDDPIVDFRVTLREQGQISNQGDISADITVFYADAAPAALLGDELRVRVTFANGVATSNVACLGTTTVDNEPLEPTTDALSAVGRSARRVADKVGRYLLMASAAILAATAAWTLMRRLFPPLL